MEKFKREKEREEIEKFEKTKNIVWESIGYEFQNSKLLMEAVTHTKSSYLTSIGDSVLGKVNFGLCLMIFHISSLLDKVPNYVFGCIIQKRYFLIDKLIL